MSWYDDVVAVTASRWQPASKLKASGDCYAVVKHFESYRRKAYKDTGGVWTVGYGETQGVTSSSIMEHDEALRALHRRMEEDFAPHVREGVSVDITQSMFDALCSFTYNLGPGQFLSSTLLRKLNGGDVDGAADEFLRWVYDDGVELAGLVRRRKCERALFLGEDHLQFMEG